MFNNEHKEIIAEVLFLSLKKFGDIGLTNSVLKYPNLFSFLALLKTINLLDICK